MAASGLEISQITIFPFKSLNGIDLTDILISEHGFLHDRMYMLAYKSEQNEWLPVPRIGTPELRDIQVEMQNSEVFKLTYKLNNETFQLELPFAVSNLPHNMDRIVVRPWSDTMDCFNVGSKLPQLPAYFARILRKKYKDLTVVVASVKHKHPDTDFLTKQYTVNEGPSSFANFQDLWPATLITTGSAAKLVSNNEFPDLRANLVVESTDSFSENKWRELKIAGHLWAVDLPKPEVAKANKDVQYFVEHGIAKNPERLPYYGSNIINHDYNYVIKLGDRVEVVDEIN